MKINVKAENITLTPDIYEYLDKRLAPIEKIIQGDSAAMAHVEIGKPSQHHKTGNFFEARIQLHVSGRDFTALATGDSVYSAIDGMKDDITRELTTHKDKQLTRTKKGGRHIKNILRRMWPFGGRE